MQPQRVRIIEGGKPIIHAPGARDCDCGTVLVDVEGGKLRVRSLQPTESQIHLAWPVILGTRLVALRWRGAVNLQRTQEYDQ